MIHIHHLMYCYNSRDYMNLWTFKSQPNAQVWNDSWDKSSNFCGWEPPPYTGFLCEYFMLPPPNRGEGHLITWARAPRCPQCTTAFGAFDRKKCCFNVWDRKWKLKSSQYYLGRPELLCFIAEPGQGAPLLVNNPTDSIWFLLRRRNYLLFETPSSCWPRLS